jgi:hypothetical protein
VDGISIGQRVLTKKPHICGNIEWMIFQIADRIGIRCIQCGKKVFISSYKFSDYIQSSKNP